MYFTSQKSKVNVGKKYYLLIYFVLIFKIIMFFLSQYQFDLLSVPQYKSSSVNWIYLFLLFIVQSFDWSIQPASNRLIFYAHV